MLHSSFYHKETNEDPKTSSIFETILMLPDEIVWMVLRNACFDNHNLPKFAGQIESFQFWPHWDASGTNNSNLVEPDVFIRFEEFDLIIEAKYGDAHGQYQQQWENELKSYYNEFEEHDKGVFFIAVGGNASKNNEKVIIKRDITINKCSWLSLLMQINKFNDDIKTASFKSNYNSYLSRQLSLIELAFNINGVYNTKWFDDLKSSSLIISTSSISTLNLYFDGKRNG